MGRGTDQQWKIPEKLYLLHRVVKRGRYTRDVTDTKEKYLAETELRMSLLSGRKLMIHFYYVKAVIEFKEL